MTAKQLFASSADNRNVTDKKMKNIASILLTLLALSGCAGEDVNPVYFPGVGAETKPSEAATPNTAAPKGDLVCQLELTAKLCVKVKGENIGEVSTCSETPPIPFHIEGEKVRLKGSEFPDIQVKISIKGVDTPITLNGHGTGEGTDNIGEGTWTPEGDLKINNFSFYINVLGTTAEVPGLTITTGAVEALPDLEAITGKPVQADGTTTLVSGLVLGSLFEAADKYLLGASLQATFDGKFTPPLAECITSVQGENALRIVKLRSEGEGNFVEEPLPNGDILEVSSGTFVAESPQDTGDSFTATSLFKIINDGNKPMDLQIPAEVGPFYFETKGISKVTLQPKHEFRFGIDFRPTLETAPKAGAISTRLVLGGKLFHLNGVALARAGKIEVDLLDSAGQPLAVNRESLTLPELDLPTRQGKLWIGNPSEGDGVTPSFSSQTRVALQNRGPKPLQLKKIWIEELPKSKSMGEFSLGNSLTLPLTLTPQTPAGIALQVYYHPKDLIGWDGTEATTSLTVTDRAHLVLETDAGVSRILLVGKTKILDVPQLQAMIATATGYKTKAPMETFTFEEVTSTSENIAYPVFLKLAEASTEGFRITEFRIEGEHAESFEWLDTPEKLNDRQPAAGKGKRCSIPTFDPETGQMVDEQFDLNFLPLGSQGYDLTPQTIGTDKPPLFGCINFHQGAGTEHQRIVQANLVVNAIKLDSTGKLKRNPDNSYQTTQLVIPLLAARDPVKGNMVLRIPQTMSLILNPSSPSLGAVPSKKEAELLMRDGRGSANEMVVFLGAIILDPFDEMEIRNEAGIVENKPGDGITGVFRALKTQSTAKNYEEEWLQDYSALLHDSKQPDGPRLFDGFGTEAHPLPDPLQVNGWRLFTGALSYPGPFSPKSPIARSECVEIDPCSSTDLVKFTESGVGSDGKGACAFFYASAGKYHSPTFEPVIRNEIPDLCATRDQPQELLDMDNGHVAVDGSMTFEDIGLRLWGPTYFHNPHGPLGPKPPLDDVLHIAFTTEMLKPKDSPRAYEVLPDEKLDRSKFEYKINLTESDLANPPICPTNLNNRQLGGKTYSSWKYLAPLLFEDEAGTIPAGCSPDFKGGTAFIKGRRLDPVDKTFSIVAAAKFASREELSLAMKDIAIFIVLNGWMCDPQGSEENFEGQRCFDSKLNERDAKAQISITGD